MKNLKMNEKALVINNIVLNTDCVNGCLCLAAIGNRFIFLEHTSSLNFEKLSLEWNKIIKDNNLNNIELFVPLYKKEKFSEEGLFFEKNLNNLVKIKYYIMKEESNPMDNFVRIENNKIITGLNLKNKNNILDNKSRI